MFLYLLIDFQFLLRLKTWMLILIKYILMKLWQFMSSCGGCCVVNKNSGLQFNIIPPGGSITLDQSAQHQNDPDQREHIRISPAQTNRCAAAVKHHILTSGGTKVQTRNMKFCRRQNQKPETKNWTNKNRKLQGLSPSSSSNQDDQVKQNDEIKKNIVKWRVYVFSCCFFSPTETAEESVHSFKQLKSGVARACWVFWVNMSLVTIVT